MSTTTPCGPCGMPTSGNREGGEAVALVVMLVTRDRRALATYRALEVDVELLG